jgi:hypothetical protein
MLSRRNGIWTAVKSGCRSNLKIDLVGTKILKIIFSAKFELGLSDYNLLLHSNVYPLVVTILFPLCTAALTAGCDISKFTSIQSGASRDR